MTSTPTVFLWGERFDRPRSSGNVSDGEWWRQYSERLRMSSEALAELAESSRCVMSLLPPPDGGSGFPRPVRGAVVGSVQSGKTSHMLALTARALDQGYKCVVVLAGLKDDLRAQTARRFNVQLLRQRDPLGGGRPGFTLPLDASHGRVRALAPPYFVDCHQWTLFHVKMSRAVATGIPIVAVIKKNKASLSNMRERIRQSWTQVSPLKFPLLILDDECDEGSVEPDESAPTPELIENLWRVSDGQPPGAVAYVGYTATVAANLLQKPENALYPSDFVYLLRAPSWRESTLTFREPAPHNWYCGGETFYERFIRPVDGGSSLLVEPSILEEELARDPDQNESLKQAIRCFLVGAAIRRLEHPELSFEDASNHPPPHTMIVQASTAIADHDKWARAIRRFLDIDGAAEGASEVALGLDVEAHNERWVEAVASLEQSRAAVNELQPHPWPMQVFDWDALWPVIRSLASRLRLRVLNSAPGTVDGLDFEAASDPDGRPVLPSDLLSIVVGGGRLSRGLTVDGLSVSYFARWADTPAEDTILQLSRWYGYRGPHVDCCRVFTTEAIARDLTWIHSHDQEMRARLASLMQDGATPREAGIVLSSIPHGLPTAKLGVGQLRNVIYSPWCRALSYVEIGQHEQHNETLGLELFKSVRRRGGQAVRSGAGAVRGLISSGWTMSEVVAVLEGLEFTHHNPAQDLAMLGSSYRVPDATRTLSSVLPEELDPYAIAAYLRLWHANVAGEYKPPPLFNVGVSYGSESSANSPFEFPLANREVSASGFVNGGWIGRSDGWPGDQVFDGVSPTLLMDESSRRSEKAPGLLLLYVIHRDSLGRRGRGVKRARHSVMLGISIPAGGPVFRRVLLPPSRTRS